MTDEFADQFIEGDATVKKTTDKPKPVPRATKEALLLGKMIPREEIREVLATEAEEAEAVTEKEESAALLTPGPRGHEKITRLLTEEDKAVITKLSTDDEKLVAHALEILPHLGPEATAAYLASATKGETGQHAGTT